VTPSRAWPYLVLLATAGLLTFGNSFNNTFVHDDVGMPTTPALQHVSTTWEATYVRPGAPFTGRPVVALSLTLNHAANDFDPRGYHVVNTLLHVMCALALFGVIRRTLRGERLRDRFSAHADLVACAASLLWLVHPLQTEVVNYISQRTESLMALFYLLTLYCAIRARQRSGPRPKGRAYVWTACAIVACALGMMSKESMVTAPVTVLLYDWAFAGADDRGGRRGWWQGRVPLYVGLAATWVVLGALMAGAPRGETVGAASGVSAQMYALNQAVIVLHYLRLVVWPVGLAVDYGPTLPISFADAALAISVLAIVAVAAVVTFLRNPPLGFAALWFFITLAPSSSIVPIGTEVGAERRMYLPLAGIATLIAGALYLLLARPHGRADIGSARHDRTSHDRTPHTARPHVARTYATIVAVIALPLAVASALRNRDYREEEQLWRTSVAARPNASAYNNFGAVLARNGKFAEAVDAYQQALAALQVLKADNETSTRFRKLDALKFHRNLANAYERLGNTDGAIVEYRELVRASPNAVDLRLRLGNALIAKEAFDEAAAELRQYLVARPQDAGARNGLCLALLSSGHVPQAIAECQASITLKADDPLTHFNLGVALTIAGRRDEGARALAEAVRLDPTMRADVDGFLQSSGRPH
jgi:tetratricopeptide (TPR) repeat protein